MLSDADSIGDLKGFLATSNRAGTRWTKFPQGPCPPAIRRGAGVSCSSLRMARSSKKPIHGNPDHAAEVLCPHQPERASEVRSGSRIDRGTRGSQQAHADRGSALPDMGRKGACDLDATNRQRRCCRPMGYHRSGVSAGAMKTAGASDWPVSDCMFASVFWTWFILALTLAFQFAA